MDKNKIKNSTAYHYTTIEGLMGIVESKTLHATNINCLNDPSESKYFDSWLNNLLKTKSENKKLYDLLYEDWKDYLHHFGEYVVSFSLLKDFLPMWYYYSSGNGIRIEFDLNELIDCNENENLKDDIEIFNVLYDEEKQANLLKIHLREDKTEVLNYYDKKKGAYEDRDLNKLMQVDDDFKNVPKDFIESIYELKRKFKHPAYEYECEVRLLIINDLFTDLTVGHKKKNSSVIEYIEIPINISAIKSVLLHPVQTAENENIITRFLKKNNLKCDVDISQIPFRHI